MLFLAIILGVLLLLALFLWLTYNTIVTAKMRVDESFSGIDVQLKRRSSLIPNLVEVVKGYAQHEKEIFEEVAKARSRLMEAGSPQEKAQADNLLTGALKSLFAVAESYPQLKANENFLQLQNELTDTEDKIAYSRQFYNGNVMDYNTKLKVFPNVLLAGMFNFKEAEFFEAEGQTREDIKVSFQKERGGEKGEEAGGIS